MRPPTIVLGANIQVAEAATGISNIHSLSAIAINDPCGLKEIFRASTRISFQESNLGEGSSLTHFAETRTGQIGALASA